LIKIYSNNFFYYNNSRAKGNKFSNYLFRNRNVISTFCWGRGCKAQSKAFANMVPIGHPMYFSEPGGGEQIIPLHPPNEVPVWKANEIAQKVHHTNLPVIYKHNIILN